jgi:hypothetical protein
MNLFDKWSAALPHADFLAKYGTAVHQARWKQTFDRVTLTAPQRELLAAFKRPMPVLCLAGAWCGDCSGQCPVFERFAEVAPVIQVRYLDRDAHADVQRELKINGGDRVPVAVFFSEDGCEVARFGERTLTKYRQLVQALDGASCPTGVAAGGEAGVVQEWLDQFERVQWILRLSPRLRQMHGD